jgi:membrane dipeptidase
MVSKGIWALSFLVCISQLTGCGSGGLSQSTLSEIRKAQERMLTVDAHVGNRNLEKFINDMRSGGLDAAVFMVEPGESSMRGEDDRASYSLAVDRIRQIRRVIEAHASIIGFARTADEAYRLEKEGRRAAYIGLADGDPIGADAARVSSLYAEGLLFLSLCGARDNAICDSALDAALAEDRGLSGFGRKVVAECNRLGVVIDIAQCSSKAFFDVLETSRSPVIVSRAAAWHLSSVPGNLTDEMIRAVAEKGGVIMASLERARLVAGLRSRAPTVADFADHIDHIVEVGGIASAGIGSGFGEGGGISGCSSPRQILGLTVELLRRGYSESRIEAVWGGNVMRVVRRAQETAAAGGKRREDY